MKILIVRFSKTPEIILSTPFIRCVRNKYPDAEIHFLVKKEFAETLAANNYLDKIISFEGDLRDTILLLLAEEYELIFDLQSSIRSANVTAMLRQAFNSKVKVYRANNMRFRKFLMHKMGIHLLPDRNLAEQFLRAGKKLGVANDGNGLDYFIPEDDKIKNEDLPMSHSAGYVSFVIGGANGLAKLSAEDWKTLCEKVNYPVILQGDATDEKLGEEIRKLDPIRIYNSCGKFNMHEQADIIRCAKVVVTNENDLMHIAAAFKRKIIAVLQARRPQLGYYPYYGYNNLKSTISPDSKLLVGKQKGGQLTGINIAEVTDAVHRFLKQ